MKIDFSRARKILGSLCLSAGILALANVETIWQEYHHDELQENHQSLKAFRKAQGLKRVQLALNPEPIGYPAGHASLSQSLEQDELLEENPFAHLSTLDPLQAIVKKGVVRFERETYRSPNYQQESGYDLLSYVIHQVDGTESTILAYLERAEVGSSTSGERLPFVVFVLTDGNQSKYFFFRSGNLVEQSDLSHAEAQSLVSRRLSSGIPFLSVSR